MEKFIYINSLESIKEGLQSRKDYTFFHLVDQIHLVFVSLKGDFITVLNDEQKEQMFSLSHMYHKRAIQPDDDLFSANVIGQHDNDLKHKSGQLIESYSTFLATLESYGFDGFYQIMNTNFLFLTLKRKALLCARYRQDPAVNMQEVYLSKVTTQDQNIHYKENIDNFVALHYRPKNDQLLSSYHILTRQKANKVLVRFKATLLQDPNNKCYPLSNYGLDLIFDQHFYQLNLNNQNYPLYQFDKYDYVAMFSSYDNHQHSTMVRTSFVLIYDQISIEWIDALIFENEEDKILFLNDEKYDKDIIDQYQIKIEVKQDLFY